MLQQIVFVFVLVLFKFVLVLQCVAAESVLQSAAVYHQTIHALCTRCSVLQFVALCSSVLQCIAVCCSVS